MLLNHPNIKCEGCRKVFRLMSFLETQNSEVCLAASSHAAKKFYATMRNTMNLLKLITLLSEGTLDF